MLKIFLDLEIYHKKLIGHTSEDEDVLKFPSFFASKLLYDAEKEILSSEVDLFESGSEGKSEHGFLVPSFEITRFPYVIEDRDFNRNSSNRSAQMNDLSTEIEKKDLNVLKFISNNSSKPVSAPIFLLFSGDIFQESFEHQMRKFMKDNEKGNALKNMRSIIDVLQNVRDDPSRKWNDDDDDGNFDENEMKDGDEEDEEGDDDEEDGDDDDDDDGDDEVYDDEDDEGFADGDFEMYDDDDDETGSTTTVASSDEHERTDADWENTEASFQVLIEGGAIDEIEDMDYQMYNLGNGRLLPILSDDVNKNLVFSSNFFAPHVTISSTSISRRWW